MKKILSAAMAVLMIVSLLAVSAFAADEFPSPDGRDYFTVSAKVKGDKGGTATVSAATVPAGETVTITAKADDGYTFGGWTFEGKFEWVSGDANSATIVVRPQSDIVFTASYNGQGGSDKDNSNKAPQMGYNFEACLAVMAAVIAVSAAAVVYTGKKYYSSAR